MPPVTPSDLSSKGKERQAAPTRHSSRSPVQMIVDEMGNPVVINVEDDALMRAADGRASED